MREEGTSDGFFIVLNTPDGALLLTSADGRSWSESPLDHYGPVNAVRIGATTWYAGVIGGPYRIQRSNGGEAPSTVATFDGVQPGDVLDAGPAGLVATVWQVPAVVVDRLPSERIARDGYELRFNEPEGAVTLWDQNADRAVYEFDFEALRSDAPPESVREYHEESGYWNVVFEDPETGADLVTFTLDDLVPVLSSLAMSLGKPLGSRPVAGLDRLVRRRDQLGVAGPRRRLRARRRRRLADGRSRRRRRLLARPGADTRHGELPVVGPRRVASRPTLVHRKGALAHERRLPHPARRTLSHGGAHSHQ